MVDSNTVDNVVTEKLARQRVWCFKDFVQKKEYLQGVIKTIVWGIGIAILIIGGVVGWSYKPIQDIAIMKTEIKLMNLKLDKIYMEKKMHAFACPACGSSEIEMTDNTVTCLDCGRCDVVVKLKPRGVSRSIIHNVEPALSAVCSDGYKHKD